MNIRNLSISRQIGLGFLIAILLLVLSGVLNSMSLKSLNATTHSIYYDRVHAGRDLLRLQGLTAL